MMTVTLNLRDVSSNSSTRRALSELSLAVSRSKKIVVVTGAGISCSCGIPDFRSSDGLYALVKQQYPNVVLKGRDLFDAALFRDSTLTAVFYTFISQLKRSIDSASPGPTHHFIKTLDTKRRLLRSYTQNIDGLEERAGLLCSSSNDAKASGKGKYRIKARDVRNVQLHGDIHRVRCVACSAEYPYTEEYLRMFNEGKPPDCPDCTARSEARAARSARATRVGTLRPAIVLYDEPHPLGDDIGSIQTADVSRRPDMLIIMGTSLKVHGLKKLIKDFAKAVHAQTPSTSTSTAKAFPGKVIFVNRTPPGSEWADIIDYHVAGETDTWCTKVLEDWKKTKPSDWQVQQKLVAADGDVSMAVTSKTVKEVSGKKDKKKSRANENIPPPPVSPMVLCSPGAPLYVTKSPGPPISPSKRRGSTCHYAKGDSSPSKKRLGIVDKEKIPSQERGLLFGNQTNIDIDLSMEFLEIEPRKAKAKLSVAKEDARCQKGVSPVERKPRTATVGRRTRQTARSS